MSPNNKPRFMRANNPISRPLWRDLAGMHLTARQIPSPPRPGFRRWITESAEIPRLRGLRSGNRIYAIWRKS